MSCPSLGDVLDHIGVQVGDVEASLALYLRVVAPIGLQEAMRFEAPYGPVVGLAS